VRDLPPANAGLARILVFSPGFASLHPGLISLARIRGLKHDRRHYTT